MVLKRKTDNVEGEKGWVDRLIPEEKIRSSKFILATIICGDLSSESCQTEKQLVNCGG